MERKSTSSDVITRAYLDSLLVEVRHLDAVMPSTEMTVYGKTFSTPVATAALSHMHRQRENGMAEMARGAAMADMLVFSGMGAMGRATMIHQKGQKRYCINLLYAAPVKRGLAQVIEDILPVYNIGITLDIPETIKRAYQPLRGTEIPVTVENGLQKLTLPELSCHESIVLEYGP